MNALFHEMAEKTGRTKNMKKLTVIDFMGYNVTNLGLDTSSQSITSIKVSPLIILQVNVKENIKSCIYINKVLKKVITHLECVIRFP